MKRGIEMSSDFIFRGAVFGGFNKADVINYVDMLQNDLAELRKRADELNLAFQEQNIKLNRIPELEKELADREKVFEDNKALTQKISELESEKSKTLEEYEKVKTAEAQLGAAFVDARRYSDKIISAAKDRASCVSKEASDDITQKASQIRAVASDADKLALDFSKKMDELTKSISALSSKMSAVAVNLVKTEAKTDFKPRIDFSELEKMGIENTDDVTAVTKDEESGMTFVTYAPNTSFNADLEIDADELGEVTNG